MQQILEVITCIPQTTLEIFLRRIIIWVFSKIIKGTIRWVLQINLFKELHSQNWLVSISLIRLRVPQLSCLPICFRHLTKAAATPTMLLLNKRIKKIMWTLIKEGTAAGQSLTYSRKPQVQTFTRQHRPLFHNNLLTITAIQELEVERHSQEAKTWDKTHLASTEARFRLRLWSTRHKWCLISFRNLGKLHRSIYHILSRKLVLFTMSQRFRPKQAPLYRTM
jgi:hypothetical protein